MFWGPDTALAHPHSKPVSVYAGGQNVAFARMTQRSFSVIKGQKKANIYALDPVPELRGGQAANQMGVGRVIKLKSPAMTAPNVVRLAPREAKSKQDKAFH